ncbi:MAG: putative metal-binding motif-containing protein, partial [Alphaproteobacteria bacterium]
ASAFAGDCNDMDAVVFPGAPELCDGKDNNRYLFTAIEPA